MKYFKILKIGALLSLLLFTISCPLSAQTEISPTDLGYGRIDLKVGPQPGIEMIAIEDGFSVQNNNFGSKLYMYKNNIFVPSRRTVTLNAGTGPEGSYGSLRLDAYTNVDPFVNANNVGVPSSAPYAMISLAKRTSSSYTATQDYSWNIGVYNEFEYDASVGDYDCQDCLTFAHQEGSGAAFYKFSFGSDADYQSASDARLKENIEDVESSLDKILELSAKNYHYIWSKKNPNRKSSGFLAQDVQKVFPELVSSIRQPNGEKTLMLNYIGMIPYITKGMQEQQDIIANQDEQISDLRTMIDQLSTQVKVLQELNEK